MTVSAVQTFQWMVATSIIWTKPHPIHYRYKIWICMHRTSIIRCSTTRLRWIHRLRGISIQSISCILCKTHISVRSNETDNLCHLLVMRNGIMGNTCTLEKPEKRQFLCCRLNTEHSIYTKLYINMCISLFCLLGYAFYVYKTTFFFPFIRL